MSTSISREQNNIAMNGYFFTAGLTQSQIRPTPGRGGQLVDRLLTWDNRFVRGFTLHEKRQEKKRPGLMVKSAA